LTQQLGAPLRAISDSSEHLRQALHHQAAGGELSALDGIDNATSELRNITADLVANTTLKESSLPLQFEQFEICKLVEEVYQETLAQIADRNIEYGYHLPQHPLWINGDRGRIKQIILHLVSNAFRATEEGAITITVSEHHHSNRVCIQIEDSGVGMAPEDSKRILQKFASIRASEPNPEATGLGLYMAMQLVQLHQGNLSFTSTPGTGTCFRLELPLPNLQA
jgi:signal transduction histidine kinase